MASFSGILSIVNTHMERWTDKQALDYQAKSHILAYSPQNQATLLLIKHGILAIFKNIHFYICTHTKGILISMCATNETESQGKHGDRIITIIWPQRWFSRFRSLPPTLVTLVQSLGPT